MYDPAIIEEFANRLLKKARTIVVVSTLLGAIVGAAGAYGTTVSAGYADQTQVAIAFLGAFLGAVAGLYLGRERAFHYRLVAQTALCQVNIENNTRISAEVMSQWGSGSQQRNAA